MKKLLALILSLALFSVPSFAEAPDSSTVYQTDDISFSITNTYLHRAPGNDFIIIEFRWKNISNEPQDFSMKLITKGFQNGKEMSLFNYEPDYDTDMMVVNSMTEIMPGYENTDYDFIPIKDDSEVTITVDQMLEVGNSFEEITYTVIPSELPEFQWPEE